MLVAISTRHTVKAYIVSGGMLLWKTFKITCSEVQFGSILGEIEIIKMTLKVLS